MAAKMADTEESMQLNTYMRVYFVTMLDMIVADEANERPTTRSVMVADLIRKEFRRRKLKLDSTLV